MGQETLRSSSVCQCPSEVERGADLNSFRFLATSFRNRSLSMMNWRIVELPTALIDNRSTAQSLNRRMTLAKATLPIAAPAPARSAAALSEPTGVR
jgi:hypothetical protein